MLGMWQWSWKPGQIIITSEEGPVVVHWGVILSDILSMQKASLFGSVALMEHEHKENMPLTIWRQSRIWTVWNKFLLAGDGLIFAVPLYSARWLMLDWPTVNQHRTAFLLRSAVLLDQLDKRYHGSTVARHTFVWPGRKMELSHRLSSVILFLRNQ